MLALLRSIGPLAALLVGMATGGTLLGGLAWAYNVLIDNPQVAREAAARASDACAIRVADAASRAETAERARQERVSADAMAAWRAAAEAQEQHRRAAENTLEQERADYERQLREAGRSRVIDDGDFGWLRRKPGSSPAGAGR